MVVGAGVLANKTAEANDRSNLGQKHEPFSHIFVRHSQFLAVDKQKAKPGSETQSKAPSQTFVQIPTAYVPNSKRERSQLASSLRRPTRLRLASIFEDS